MFNLQQSNTHKLFRLLIFVIIIMIIIRYFLDIDLSDMDQLKIILSVTVVYIGISTFYPYVVVKND
jgi:hypothetical protein